MAQPQKLSSVRHRQETTSDDAGAFHEMLAAQNQGNPQFHTTGGGLLQQQQPPQVPASQQHQAHDHPNSNAMMMQMMMAAQQQQQQQQQQPFPTQQPQQQLQQQQTSGLMDSRLGASTSDAAPSGTMPSLWGNPNALFDPSSQGHDMMAMSQQQSLPLGGGGSSLQSNLRQLEMANELLQRRLSMGVGGGGPVGGYNPNQLDMSNRSLGGSSAGGGGGPAMLDQLQGLEPSNLQGLVASQSQLQQQQQQQLAQMQQLMMATATQPEQQHRRASFIGAGAGGTMNAALGMQQLQSMMMGHPQQQPFPTGMGRMDMSGSFAQQPPQFQFYSQDQLSQPARSAAMAEQADAMRGASTTATAGAYSFGDDKVIYSPPMTLDDPSMKKPRKKKAKTFPEKLMDAIVHFGEEDGVAWLPDGRSFVIVNDEVFVDQVLNQAFKESKYTSFVRKLHRWGFVRLTSGTGTDCFHHPLFQRGRRDLAKKITCTPRDKNGNLKTPHRNMKPPSLAGVEKFIRRKADAAVAIAEAKVRSRDLPVGEAGSSNTVVAAVAAAAAADDDDDDDAEDDDDPGQAVPEPTKPASTSAVSVGVAIHPIAAADDNAREDNNGLPNSAKPEESSQIV